jgi:hypothetical protein
MDENLGLVIIFLGGGVAFCTFLSIAAWSSARRREREAFYRAEAIKKVAEMQGATPEPVLNLLREALKPPPEPASPWDPRIWNSRVREAAERSELRTKITETPGMGPPAALEVLHEEERIRGRRVREGLKLAGLITAGVGVGLFIFLQQLIPYMPVYLVGLIPILVGAAFLAYAFVLAPGD